MVPRILKPVLGPYWPRIRVLIYYSLFINLMALATPIFIRQVYDRVVFHAGMSTLMALSVGMLLAIAFDFILRQARSRLMQNVSLRIDVSLSRRLFGKLLTLPLRTLETRPASYWLALFRDADRVRDMLGGQNAVLLVDIPFVALFIGLVYVFAQPIVWVLVAALFAYVVLAWWSSSSVQRASRTERTAGLSRDALITEIIAGRTTVKALAAGPALQPAWEDRQAGSIEAALSRGNRSDTFGNVGMALTVFTTVAMTGIGALAILEQSMTIGGLIAANILATRIIAPLNQLVGAWRNFATYREAANRLAELLALAEERTESEIKFSRPSGTLTLEEVSFGFDPNARPVVSKVNFTLKPGGLHGIVGRNGSGKSTLLKLMQGLYVPTDGRVLLDGGDIRQFPRNELSRWYGYVPQECVLFSGSVHDNICKGMPGATDEEILATAQAVGVHDDIVDLPDGYNTDIGEAGSRLSAGQRQKIAIARALLGDPPLLLLDEPTSNLDRPTEEKFRDVLLRLAKDRNVVIVTHSPVLLSACDNVIVLDKGRVVMAGGAAETLPRLLSAQGMAPVERKP